MHHLRNGQDEYKHATSSIDERYPRFKQDMRYPAHPYNKYSSSMHDDIDPYILNPHIP